MSEGRSCPLAYRYAPESLCREPTEVSEDVLYIVGGLYGNPFALDAIEQMALAEERQGRRVRLVFNGDFNWFNADDTLFQDINKRVLAHTASLGNVEYELANASAGAGCGCAYPEFVDQGVVERSNRIMEKLQGVAEQHPDIQEKLALLPRYQCLMFGGLKVLVLHGDPESLAGWGLAHESFSAANESALCGWLRDTGADVIACTHTCLPVLWSGEVENCARVVANNGSAGMGNLQADPRGLITRIGLSAPATEPVVAFEQRGVHISLLPVSFDVAAWLARFDELWPAGSDAAVSYRSRILNGTSLNPEQVVFPSGS
ncbi:hypothetical protein BKP64_14590 [Marinobacter salinus]|uniref:Calcineurin-like phosphoesterase domain-containing protein n=1 Tax=Marinobacter salinus TaxID=1874317 RepID=A0A1D9GNX4_9GAMM|nr:hypothetical protein [Marinobacter salinus]AOY89299.1 hypothetical protein BKP64_14590 [Marinobacter salinus]